jgi:toxoflavin synthase
MELGLVRIKSLKNQYSHGIPSVNLDPSTPFDGIALDYVIDAERRLDRQHILVPSAQYYCGDLNGKKVLDLGCGAGFFSRLLEEWGAKSVLALDISPSMIELAKSYDPQRRYSGVNYQINDASTLNVLGEFDVIFASFLLHYAPTIDVLCEMCQSIASNLRSGGQFITFNENPSFPVHDGIKYDVLVSAQGNMGNGTQMVRTHYREGKLVFSFNHYHWEKETYESALRQAGFININWMPFIKSESADHICPHGYWDEYTSCFSTIVLTATLA